MKAIVMTDPTSILPPIELPAQLQIILNAIAFLISAIAVWYAYFIRGKAGSKKSSYDGLASNSTAVRISKDIERIATSIEKIEKLMRAGQMENEIDRRVHAELNRLGIKD